MSYIVEQQTILFYRHILRSPIALSFALLLQLKQGFVSSLLLKCINTRSLSHFHCNKILLWNAFVANAANADHINVSF